MTGIHEQVRAVSVLAAPDPGGGNGGGVGPTLNGATSTVINNIIPFIILCVGAYLLARASKRNMSDSATVVAGVILALFVIGLALVGNVTNLSGQLFHLVFS